MPTICPVCHKYSWNPAWTEIRKPKQKKYSYHYLEYRHWKNGKLTKHYVSQPNRYPLTPKVIKKLSKMKLNANGRSRSKRKLG